MNSCILLQKLIEIERSIGVETESALRRKVLNAQDCLLGELVVERLQNQAEENGDRRFSLLRAFSSQNLTEEES